MAAYITVGATTTHGGKVISGSPHTTHNGVQVSRKGDKVLCKKCKKVTTILTGDPSFMVDGAPIARDGDVTSCGDKLIAIQQSFAESDFEVMGVEQPAPLQFPKSDPDALFASFAAKNNNSEKEMTDEELGVWIDVSTQRALQEGGLWAGTGTPEELIYQERLNSLWIDVDGDRARYYESVQKIGDEAGLVFDIMSFPLAGTGTVKAGKYIIKSRLKKTEKARAIEKTKIKNNNQIDDDLGNRPLGGAHRANQHSHDWKKASLKDARKKFAGDDPKVTHTKSGKTIHENRNTGVQVVYDKEGDYFTLVNPAIKGDRKYLDLDGTIPNNKTIPNGKKAGRNKSEYREATHFKVDR